MGEHANETSDPEFYGNYLNSKLNCYKQVYNLQKLFQTDWNDGKLFCEIIKGLGGSCPPPEKLSSDPDQYENNIRKAVEAGNRLGVRPVLAPKDMANPEVEHLGIMSYATSLQFVSPRPPLADMLRVLLVSTSGRIGEPTYFRVEILTREIEISDVKAFIDPPHSDVLHQVKVDQHGEGMYIPEKYGMHEIILQVKDDQLGGHFFRVLPIFLHVPPPGMSPCALGSLVEVLVNATGAPKTEDILVTAYSPSGRSHKCPLKKLEEGHSAIFKPDEAGIWEIAVTYQGRHIQGGPFTCAVFDPSGVSVHGLDGAMPFKAHAFEIDARGTGVTGELHVDIVHEKRSLVCAVEQLSVENKYQCTFMPRSNGRHRVYIYFNGYDVKGSPFIMRVGTKGRSGKTRSSPGHENKLRSESPLYNTSHYNSMVNRSTELYSTKRDLYSPQNTPKSGSYSPSRQSPAKFERLSSPRRDLYSPPRHDQTDHYATTYKTETKKTVRSSPVHDYVKKSLSPAPRIDDLYSARLMSPSPVRNVRTDSVVQDQIFYLGIDFQISNSTLRNSPITFSSTKHYETSTRNTTSSPSLIKPSPVNYSTTTVTSQRSGSPTLKVSVILQPPSESYLGISLLPVWLSRLRNHIKDDNDLQNRWKHPQQLIHWQPLTEQSCHTFNESCSA